MERRTRIGAALAAAALGAALAGCDECEPEDTRCRGPRVEVCSSGGAWDLLMDCDEVAGGAAAWVCCADPEAGGVTCLPADECDGGAP